MINSSITINKTEQKIDFQQTQQKVLEARDKLEKLRIKPDQIRLPSYLNFGQGFPQFFCPVQPSMYYATAPSLSHQQNRIQQPTFIPYAEQKGMNYPMFSPISAVVPIQITQSHHGHGQSMQSHVPFIPPMYHPIVSESSNASNIPDDIETECKKNSALPVLKFPSGDLPENVTNVEEKTFHIDIGDNEGSHVAIPVTEYIGIVDTLAYGIPSAIGLDGNAIISKHLDYELPSFLEPVADRIRYSYKTVLEGYCLKEGVKENDKRVEDLAKPLWIGCCLSIFRDNVELADNKQEMMEFIRRFIF